MDEGYRINLDRHNINSRLRADFEKEFKSELEQLNDYKKCIASCLTIAVEFFAVLDHTKRQTKLTQHSIELRYVAKKCYDAMHYYDAVRKYTESIAYAIDSSKDLALAYAHRSAASFKLNQYRDCIKDVNRALNLKYPDSMKSDLYKRRGLCLMALGQPDADSSLQKAIIFLDKAELSKDEKNEIKDMLMNVISNSNSAAKPQECQIGFPVSQLPTPNPKIPSCSDAVTVEYSNKYGRHVVATRKIKPGEILVTEKPFCKRLAIEHVYTNCSYCFIACSSMIPCKSCVSAAYCSKICRYKAWDEYHEIECLVDEILRSFNIDDIVLTVMRMVIIATKKGTKLDALRQELMNIDKITDRYAEMYSQDGKLYSDQYRSIYCKDELVKDNYSTLGLIERVNVTAITLCVLARDTQIFGKKLTLDYTLSENPDIKFFGELMLKHLMLVSHIKSHKFPSPNNLVSTRHGISLVAVRSFFNHSCDANTFSVFGPELMLTYAIYPIEKGEQLFTDNGLHFSLASRSTRREIFNRARFTCDCLPCTENWPRLNNILSYKSKVLLPQRRKKIDNCVQKFKTCKTLIENKLTNNEPNTFNTLVRLIEVLFVLTKKPCKELLGAVEILKLYYIKNATHLDFERCPSSENAAFDYFFSYYRQTM